MNPQMFGRYLLLDKVAAGGMAEVWRGKITGEANFQRIIAIKKILPHVSADEDFITMFTDEALITSSLVHANIGQVYEFNKVGDVFYIAMEYISGRDLKSVWSWSKARGQIMPIELAAYIVAKMCDGLDYAHSRRDPAGHVSGVVHRDISPQNVLLSWEGDVKVIDFGIAKATEKSGKTRPGTLKGKFAYMAPEQIRGLPLDGRSDIFAIGVVLYELVTGQRGFQAESEFSLLEMVRNVEIRPPSLLNQNLPAEMERIIYKALTKDRDQRYQTGADLSEDLQRFLLTRGKPPQARDLSAFLRENFTVDYEKERSRLEGYRDVNPLDFAVGAVAAVPPASSVSLDEDSAFASSEPSTVAPEPIGPPSVAPAMQTGPHTTSMVNALHPPENTSSTNTNLGEAPSSSSLQVPKGRSKLPAIMAASVLGVAALGGIGFGLWKTVLQPTSTVVVNVQGPAQASVRFDDHPLQTASPSVTLEKIAKGTHTLIVEAPGFVTVPLTIVTDGEPLFPVNATLKRVAGKLTVTSKPSGGAVTLDGKPTDKTTPCTFDVDGDSIHEIRVNLPGYKEALATDQRVKGGEENTVKVELKPSLIRLRIVSDPEGASVKIGEADYGLTPVEVERMPDDPYPQVTLSAPRCETMTTTVPFDRDKAENRFDVKLKCR